MKLNAKCWFISAGSVKWKSRIRALCVIGAVIVAGLGLRLTRHATYCGEARFFQMLLSPAQTKDVLEVS